MCKKKNKKNKNPAYLPNVLIFYLGCCFSRSFSSFFFSLTQQTLVTLLIRPQLLITCLCNKCTCMSHVTRSLPFQRLTKLLKLLYVNNDMQLCFLYLTINLLILNFLFNMYELLPSTHTVHQNMKSLKIQD